MEPERQDDGAEKGIDGAPISRSDVEGLDSELLRRIATRFLPPDERDNVLDALMQKPGALPVDFPSLIARHDSDPHDSDPHDSDVHDRDNFDRDNFDRFL